MLHHPPVAGAAAGALLAAYRPLLNGLAHRLAGRDSAGLGPDDLAQTGALALLRAAGQSDPEEPGFPTYARLRVEGAMRDAMRRTVGRRGQTRHMEELADPLALEMLPDPSLTPQEFLETSALSEAVEEAMTTLPERQQLVLRMSFERGMSQHEIADCLVISVSQVARLRSTALAALRAHLSCWQD